jgi:hypothetical protein
VGNVGRHLNSGWGLNNAFPGPGDFNPRRPLWPKFGISQGIFNKCDCSNSNYNALQAKVTKRFSNNFSGLANYTYTWSRAMDFGEFGTPTNQFDQR